MEKRKILIMIALLACISVNASGLVFWESEWNDPCKVMPPIIQDAPDPDNFARGWSVRMTPFTVISYNCVITAWHWHIGIGKKLILGTAYEDPDYKVVEVFNNVYGDLSVCKVEKISDPYSVPFSKWIELYDGDDEEGEETLLCSYGPLRTEDDETGVRSGIYPRTYEHHWGKNVISLSAESYITIDFDEVGDPDYIEYEAAIWGSDSGSGWLIRDNNQWKLAGITSTPDCAVRISSGVDSIYDKIESAAEIQNLTTRYFYDTIQDAINDASDGDVIELPRRTYTENVDFLGKAITLQSRDPYNPQVAAATIIEGTGTGNTVEFSAESGAGATLLGITITCSDGSGIYCTEAEPTISHCIITDCLNYGVDCGNASPKIKNCKITDNSVGILCKVNAAAEIKNNWIYENDYYGIITLFCGPSTDILNNTIVGNTNAGIWSIGTNPTVTNCILWDNGDDLYDCSASYSWFTSDGDPLFIDVNGVDNIGGNGDDDYRLALDSPCINAGDPCYTPDPCETDIDGDPRVMGAYVDIGAEEAKRVHNITKDKWYWYINEAIDDATSGDEIVAYEDTYYEKVDFDGKAITVRSTDPGNWDVVAATIINASDSGYTVRFDSGEGSNARLKGFTITRGGKYGVYCKNTRPYIQQCAITDNGSHGICMYQTRRASCIPKIKNNKIYDNGGKGIYGYGHAPRKLRPSIKNNWIYENDSYGIYIRNGTAMVYNNTIVYNTSFGICHRSFGSTTVTNCIVWGNGNDLYGCSATYSCIKDKDTGDSESGVIHTNPLFFDASSGDFRITAGSGCIDSADFDTAPATDMFGQSRVDDLDTTNTGPGTPNYTDRGAHEFQPE